MLPPLGGIAFLPLSAASCSASIPCFRRGAHAALSPSLGAPATPGPWHATQLASYTALPLSAPPAAAPPAAGAAAGAPAGAADTAGTCAGAAAFTTGGS